MKSFRVIAHDPGLVNDPWGVVGVEYNQDDNKIKVRLAKQFKKGDLNDIMAYMNQIEKVIKPHLHIIETNGIGRRIYNYLKLRDCPWLKPVSTTGGLTDKSRKHGNAIDKPFMVGVLKDWKRLNLIEFPPRPNKDMQELIDQIPQIVQIYTPNGSTSHKARRGRHDDLFMALLLSCNVVRLHIQRLHELE